MFKRIAVSSLIVLAFMTMTLFAGDAGAQQGKSAVTSKAQAGRAAGAEDPNIKSRERPTNKADADTAFPAPPKKGGPRTRGVLCGVHVDNRTPYYIDVFVDGEFADTVTPWGDVYSYAYAGITNLYARADFEDGSYKWWGPSDVNCRRDTVFTWTLTR
jgi:hypothetical protein